MLDLFGSPASQPRARVIHGDCLVEMAKLEAESIDAVVTDPPAGIGFMGREWDSDKGGRTQWVAWMESVAREALRVVKPGGHALVWALPRTSHWTGWAWESAGWVPRDIVHHVFATGFPKSLDVSKAIDKRPGVDRHAEFATELRGAIASAGYTNTFDVAEKVVGRRTGAVANWQKYQWPEAKWWPTLRDLLAMDGSKWDAIIAEAEREKIGQHKGDMGGLGGQRLGAAGGDITAPTTDAARQWSGWGTALKPAVENWWLFRKPLSEPTVAANVLKWGCGGMNIDACRIETNAPRPGRSNAESRSGLTGTGGAATYGAYTVRGSIAVEDTTTGRWPANLVHDNSDEVKACFPESKGQIAKASTSDTQRAGQNVYGDMARGSNGAEPRGDSGSAARFFKACEFSDDEQEGRWREDDGSSLWAADDERRLFYSPKASRAERAGSKHPTVKNLTLMKWLCRLVCQPNGLILDPFSGSGTTLAAALAEGFRCVGIEREAEYVEDIRRRIGEHL